MGARQTELFESLAPVKDALSYFSEATAEQRGAIHTRPEVAAFVLDLVGWVAGPNLSTQRLLEPSAGEGDFLIPAVERLLRGARPDNLYLAPCIRAVEVNREALAECRDRLLALFSAHGWSDAVSQQVLDSWLVHADFLTLPLAPDFTHIVGNPPYLRLENLPKELLQLYRDSWSSLFDRADLYVAFIEKSLGLLKDDGRLGFICADRWMKNRYGGPLRSIVADAFHLEAYVDFTGCPAFFDEVDAYPAVTSIRRGRGNFTRVAFRPPIETAALTHLSDALHGRASHPAVSISEGVVEANKPWSFDEDGCMSLLRRLEKTLPDLESVGAKVGIGVATGADAVFIGHELDVEPSRKLPLVTTRDIRSGAVEWAGKWVLNPFDNDGKVVSLGDYPKFAAYVEQHRERIAGRNVAARSGAGWFRTIDRIHESLTWQPKLLIPDIKGSAHVVFEPGNLYPHHNLYYVTSAKWDLRALQTVLSSRVALAFVSAYSPRMRGGNLRFQAQYLRRIRLPQWDDIPKSLQGRLAEASARNDATLGAAAVRELYGFSNEEWLRLEPVKRTTDPKEEEAA